MVIGMEVGRTSHTLELRGARRMTGSAGIVLDVMVNTIVSKGRRVWEEGAKNRPRSATLGVGLDFSAFSGGSLKV